VHVALPLMAKFVAPSLKPDHGIGAPSLCKIQTPDGPSVGLSAPVKSNASFKSSTESAPGDETTATIWRGPQHSHRHFS
jgi:hypothetical protein